MIARVRIEIGDGKEDLDLTISQAKEVYDELSKIFRDPQSTSEETEAPKVVTWPFQTYHPNPQFTYTLPFWTVTTAGTPPVSGAIC